MVIDEFIVEIGLDPKNLSKGQQDALSAFKKTQEAALSAAKDIEHSSGRSVDALQSLKGTALELFAAYTGGKGIVEFVTGLTHADAAVGRVNRSTGLGVSMISRWQGAARILGGDAESMANSFVRTSDAFEGWKAGFGDPQFMADLAGISKAGGVIIDVNKGVEQSFLDLSANLKAINDSAIKGGPAMAGALGRRIGLDPALLDLLLKGPEATRKILEQVQALGPATQESADAAGELQRRWNAIFVRSEGAGRQVGVIPSILKAADFLNMTPSQAWEYLNRTDRASSPAPPKSLTPGFSASPSGRFGSGSEKEEFIRAEAIRQGQNPDVWVALAKSEGFSQYNGDPDATGKPTSFGALQLHYPGVGRNTADGLGTRFTQETGLDARNPETERQQIVWGMQYAKTHGLADWHGWYGSAFANNSGGGTTTTTIAINGPITIQAGPNADGAAIAQKFRDAVLKRQSDAMQSNGGAQ